MNKDLHFYHRKVCKSLVVLPEKSLAGGYSDGLIHIWNYTERKPSNKLLSTQTCHHKTDLDKIRRNEVYSNLVVLHDFTLAAGFPDGMIRIWNYTTRQCIKMLEADTEVRYLAVLSDITLAAGY